MRRADVTMRSVDPQIQAFLTIQPAHTLVVHDQTLPPQRHIDPAIAIADTRCRDLSDAVSKKRMVVADRTVAMARPVEAQHRTAAPLAHPIPTLQIADELAATTRLHSFERITSCSITLSSDRSATS